MFRRSMYIVILILLVSNCYSATTYYEVYRNTVNSPNTATKIKQWLTDPYYEDNDPSLVPGQQYYYWIRALSCEYTEKYEVVANGVIYGATMLVPTKAKNEYQSPVKTSIYLEYIYPGNHNGPIDCHIRESDGLLWQTYPNGSWSEQIVFDASHSFIAKDWTNDIDLSCYASFYWYQVGDAEVYFHYNFDGRSFETDNIDVTINETSDPGPMWNSISQGDYVDKIHLAWNPVSDVCSEIDFNTPVGIGWTMPISSNVTLTVNASGSGQVKVDGVVRSLPWQGTYASGTVVNLQAIQSTGWTFGYWSGVISSTSNPINVQLNNGGTITANFLNTANMAEVSFDLEPSADAYVSSYRPANNYGSENSLLVGCEQISTVLYSYESLIKFNLPTIASGTSIKDAWLKLTNSGGVGYLQMSVLCNSGSWSESGVTWNNKPSYYTLPKTSINISGNDGFGTTYLLPVQLHLNEWINNSRSNNGFRLTYSAAAGNNYSFIQASETSYNSPPELSFTVYETISNPTSISGVTSGSQGDSLSFAAGGASSNLNHSLQYRFDWGDGDQSSWGSASRSKTYTAVGQYGIRAQARCSSHTDAVSNWSPVLKTVTVAASSRSISGYVRDPGDNGIASVTVFANNGGGSTTTNSSGYYNLNIPYNWSGRITPMKTGVEFSPVYKEYSFVTSNQTSQNYTGISYAVQVMITPFLASDDGAMWRIDGGTWRPSGYTEENLSAGTHTVDFLSTTNWNAPDSRTVSITGSQSIAAHYYHIADLDTNDKINLSDYSLLSDGWQDSPCSSPDWCGGVDINRSGTVGIDDLLIMAEHWLDGSIVSEGTSLLVANHSFEEPIIDPSTNPMLSIPTVSSWVEHDTDEILGGNVGTFLNLPSTNPASILNVDGNQLAFLGSGLGNTLIQHLSATYQVGKRYQMTVSIGLSPDYPPLYQDILYLYLFYVDPNTLNWINISSSTQPAIGFRVESLKDCSLYLPTVTVNEPWAGANIGIMIHACGEPGGFWNLDNVRVTELDGMLGNGTASEPFLVSSCHHLQEINDNPSAYYKLMNDIDLSGNIYSEPVISIFSGHFDGQGHTISNLAISGSALAGLFGQIEPAGEVKNLVLENININGFDFVGSLCGYNNGGVILNCNSSGSVRGTFYVGGLCGINDGTMVRCYSSGIVEGIEGPIAIGGLVGGSGDFGGGYRGSIIDCYSTSSVIGSAYSSCLGGLCGAQDGELRNCYSMGTVVVGDSSMNIGGLCGMGNEANATNCYWDVQSSGIGNPGDNNYGAIGKTTAEMKIQSTFAGWDFINIWNIGEGDGYPYLR